MSRIAIRVAGALVLGLWVWLVHGYARVTIVRGQPLRWLAIGIGTALLLACLPPLRRALGTLVARPPRWLFLLLAALAACGISALALVLVLDTKPMSRDAAVYLMEARALAAGTLGIEVPPPALGIAARFLLAGPDGRVFGVFPPGWPLALVPFVLAGVPHAAGPVVAALLVPAQHALARALGGGEGAARAAVLLSLTSAARAFETADLLSHAFVALLGTTALVLVADGRRPLTDARALASGALAGWVTIARLLDGVVLGAGVALLLLYRLRWTPERARGRHVLLAALATVPFALVLFAHQGAATGRWQRPTQLEYFARSDWPPTCHRLGFGKDVGCYLEHPDSAARFGPDGYGPDDALAVTAERAGQLGEDLLVWAPLVLLALAAPLVRPSPATLGAATLATAFTLVYGLFYYGNAPVFGARHLFPVAPLLWALAAITLEGSASSDRDPRAAQRLASALAVVLATVAPILPALWRTRIDLVRPYRDALPEVRRALDRAGVSEGIVIVRSGESLAAAIAPDDVGRRRIYARSESLLPLMRALHPGLPSYRVEPDESVTRLASVAPRLRYPLVFTWPALVRPERVGVIPAAADRLVVHHAELGGVVRFPIWVPADGRYLVALHGVSSAVSGRWLPLFDGHAGPVFEGYGDAVRPVAVGWPRSLPLQRGFRTLELRVLGRDARSGGMLAAFETLDLEREPRPPPP